MGAGATVNETARFANVTMADSDDPRGVVYFAVGHRLPIATLMTKSLSLQVHRRASTASVMSVQYRTLVSKETNCMCGAVCSNSLTRIIQSRTVAHMSRSGPR